MIIPSSANNHKLNLMMLFCWSQFHEQEGAGICTKRNIFQRVTRQQRSLPLDFLTFFLGGCTNFFLSWTFCFSDPSILYIPNKRFSANKQRHNQVICFLFLKTLPYSGICRPLLQLGHYLLGYFVSYLSLSPRPSNEVPVLSHFSGSAPEQEVTHWSVHVSLATTKTDGLKKCH